MAKPDFMAVVSDPDFQALPFEERRKVLIRIDTEFASLPSQEQTKAIGQIAKKYHTEGIQSPQVPNQMNRAQAPEMQPAHQPPETWTDKLASARESIFGTDSNITMQGLSPYYRTALEGGGAVAGTILGTAGGPIGMAAGGGLGYAGGKAAADRIDSAGGVQKHRTVIDRYLDPVGNFMEQGSAAEVVTRPIRDAAAGVAMAGPAEGAARVLGAGTELAKRGYQAIVSRFKTPALSSRDAEKRVGEYIAENTPFGPIYAKNIEEAQAIEQTINSGAKPGDPVFKFTLAQQSGGPNLIKTERSAVLPQGPAAEQLKLREAENAEALGRFWERNFGNREGIGNALENISGQREALSGRVSAAQEAVETSKSRISSQTPEQTGAEVLSQLESAKRPIKRAMNELESEIPNYPIDLANLRTQILLIKKNPKLSLDQRKAIEAFEQNDLPRLLEQGENTFAAMGINRTLGDRAAELKKSGQLSVANIFDRLKKEGLQEDINAISELARTGKIIQSGGKMINADELAARLETGLKTLAEMRQAQAPDIDAMATAIAEKIGRRPLQVVRESDKQYLERMTKDYQRLVGGELPIKSSHTPEAIKKLEGHIADIRGVLSQASPGQDVGAAMRAYNKYASEDYFGRFKKGAVRDVLRKGDEAAGTRIKIEQIPAKFKTVSGADDFIRAVGPEQARETMRGNLGYDLLQSATGPDGKIVTKKLDAWLGKNKALLERYGMANDFKGLEKAQRAVDDAVGIAAEFEKSAAAKLIGTDPEKVIGKIISGEKSGAMMQQVVQSLKGDKAALNGLKNAFGEYIKSQAETTWPGVASGYTTSQAQVTRLMRKSSEAARVLYKDDPAKFEALQTIQRAYEIAARTSRSPVTSNSDTAEKVSNILSNMAGSIVGTSTKAQAVKAFWNYFKRMGQERMQSVLSQAIFDPEYAYSLVRGAKGTFDPKTIETTINNKIIRLEDVRLSKMRQTMIGTEAAASED